VIAVLELGLNRAVAGEIGSVEALNGMAGEIEKIMAGYNYRTGQISPL
jgi:multiple sugar transport system substrate-binding protein